MPVVRTRDWTYFQLSTSGQFLRFMGLGSGNKGPVVDEPGWCSRLFPACSNGDVHTTPCLSFLLLSSKYPSNSPNCFSIPKSSDRYDEVIKVP